VRKRSIGSDGSKEGIKQDSWLSIQIYQQLH
jgi:hypothetical protein